MEGGRAAAGAAAHRHPRTGSAARHARHAGGRAAAPAPEDASFQSLVDLAFGARPDLLYALLGAGAGLSEGVVKKVHRDCFRGGCYDEYEMLTKKSPLGLLATRRALPWTPKVHCLMPPTFRAAVRTLLLCAHRGAACGSGAGLGQLPAPVLLAIVRVSCAPLSTWEIMDKDVLPDSDLEY